MAYEYGLIYPLESYSLDQNHGVHDLSTDAMKWVLCSTLINFATYDQIADLTQLGTSNGYTTGGLAIAGRSSAMDGTDYVFDVDDPSWTASGGTIGPFRSLVLNNTTADKLIVGINFSVELGIPDGDPWSIEIASTGLIRRTGP